ncbi:MAG TPA: hypothetical protein VGK73_23755 [Polyangiaceae bacterium]
MALKRPPHLRIFLSSPGDVVEERRAAFDLLKSLPDKPWARGTVTLEVLAYDDAARPVPMSGTENPQATVNRYLGRPAACDLTIVILWGRLGTPLPGEITRDDGSSYPSGTVWELEDAERAKREIWIYRRTQEPQIGAGDPAVLQKVAQYRAVGEFFQTFTGPDGALKRGFNTYATAEQFRELLEKHLELYVSAKVKEPFRVFLADAPEELSVSRDQLAEALEGTDGIEVMKRVPPPWSFDQHELEFGITARGADLCVHLLGVGTGRAFADKAEATYPAEQARIALDVARAQLVLHPSDFSSSKVPPGPYQELLKRIESMPGERARIERVTVTKAQMGAVILKKCEELARGRLEPEPEPRACIDTRSEDFGRIGQLIQYLGSKDVEQQVLIPKATGGGPKQQASEFGQHLRTNRCFIVVCGGLLPERAYRRAHEAYRLIKENHWKTSIGMYLAPAEPWHFEPPPGFKCPVIDNLEGFNPAPIDEFLRGAGLG